MRLFVFRCPPPLSQVLGAGDAAGDAPTGSSRVAAALPLSEVEENEEEIQEILVGEMQPAGRRSWCTWTAFKQSTVTL